MFSVIIPLYNKASYIEKAIRSVLDQTFSDFELIIVNDGSADNSLEKAKCILNTRLQIIDQLNAGVSMARNNGAKQSKYDFIAFLDADDWWEPTYLEEMKSLIDDFPTAGIYGSNYFLVKNRLKKIATVGVEPDFTSGLINYCQVYAKTQCMPLWTGATVIRKAVFESENGFNPILKLGEDFDLWIRVALKFPVAFLNKPLSNYNQDVEHIYRAIGKTYDIKTNYLWNMDYLSEHEKSNKDLKNVLDHIRVTSVFSYYLVYTFRPEARKILEKVDWSLQPTSIYRKFYLTPVWQVKFQNAILKLGSKIKNWLLTILK